MAIVSTEMRTVNQCRKFCSTAVQHESVADLLGGMSKCARWTECCGCVRFQVEVSRVLLETVVAGRLCGHSFTSSSFKHSQPSHHCQDHSS